MLTRKTIIVMFIFIMLILSIICLGIASHRKPTVLEPVSKDEVKFTNTAETRTLDVTEFISAKEFIV